MTNYVTAGMFFFINKGKTHRKCITTQFLIHKANAYVEPPYEIKGPLGCPYRPVVQESDLFAV